MGYRISDNQNQGAKLQKKNETAKQKLKSVVFFYVIVVFLADERLFIYSASSAHLQRKKQVKIGLLLGALDTTNE